MPSIKFKIRTIVKALILFTFISFLVQFQQQMKHQINKVNSFIDQYRAKHVAKQFDQVSDLVHDKNGYYPKPK